MATEDVNRVTASLRQIVADLNAIGRPWALIGGLAVSARAEPRTTRDVDVVVSVADDAESEALIFELHARGYVVLSTVEQTRTSRLATARLRPPTQGPEGAIVDLLFASPSSHVGSDGHETLLNRVSTARHRPPQRVATHQARILVPRFGHHAVYRRRCMRRGTRQLAQGDRSATA